MNPEKIRSKQEKERSKKKFHNTDIYHIAFHRILTVLYYYYFLFSFHLLKLRIPQWIQTIVLYIGL